MMTKRPFSTCCLILLLQSTSGWALDVSAESPGAQSAPLLTAPTHAVTEPAKSAPALNASVKPAPVLTVPAKPAPALTAPAKPASTVLNVPAKPAPVLPVPARPAPVLTPPAKPAAAQSAPLHSLSPQSAPATQQQTDSRNQIIDIEIFVREDCPNCEQAKIFLAKLKNLHPQLTLIIRDVRKEPAALELLKRMTQNQGEAIFDYPAFVVGGQLIIGFSEEAGTARQILDTLASNPQTNRQTIECVTGTEPDCGLLTHSSTTKPEHLNINIFGYGIPLAQIGLPLFTLIMGLLDGLNYGSTWALILMISLLAPLKDRTLMLAIAGTFIAVQGIFYFLLMVVWLNLFLLIDTSHFLQIIMVGVALLYGAIYFKKYMYFGHNLSIPLHEISKPGIYTHIRQIVQTPNLFAALFGSIVLAILVQISEFSYTSIFPMLYTQVLTMHHPDSLGNYGYLLLYDLAYMLDDIIVLTIGIVTLSEHRAHEKEGRTLSLVSSLALMGIAAYLSLAVYGVI